MSKKGKRRFSRHHRRCRSHGGSSEPDNISIVDQYRHNFWHAMFRNMTPEQIFDEINEVWIDPAYQIILKRRQ